MNLTRRIIKNHLTTPAEMKAGEEIRLKTDHTLTHYITAIMGYLAFEAPDVPKVRAECSVGYPDFTFRGRLTAFAVPYIAHVSEFRAKQLWDQTAIQLMPEASAC